VPQIGLAQKLATREDLGQHCSLKVTNEHIFVFFSLFLIYFLYIYRQYTMYGI